MKFEDEEFINETRRMAERDEQRIKRLKKKRAYRAKVTITFLGGLIIGVCGMLIFARLRKADYDAALVAQTVAQLATGERELTDEDIEELRSNTQISDEETERLLSSYDDDAERSIRSLEAEVDKESELPETVHIDWGGKETVIDFTPAGEDAGAADADTTGSDEDDGADEDSEVRATRLIDELKQSLINGDGTMNALRRVFYDQIMVTSEGSFYFFPISDELEHNEYDMSRLLVSEDGTLGYAISDEKTAKKGIDVSRYQGAIDWEKVKAAGVDFAFLRAGFRGYGSGELQADETFETNALAASEQGIELGVYFFTQALNEEEAIEEAQMALDALGGREIAYPVVFDVERVSGGRMNALDRERLTDVCLAFCDKISAAGYEPMIYGNLETFMLMLDLKRLEGISKWFAYYNPEFYYPYDYDIWQYSASGRVDGIEGKVDMNLSFR